MEELTNSKSFEIKNLVPIQKLKKKTFMKGSDNNHDEIIEGFFAGIIKSNS